MRHLLLPAQVLALASLMLAGLWAMPSQGADTKVQPASSADEQKLRDAYQDTDGKSIVEFLRTRAKGEIEAGALNELIDKLDDDNATEREDACRELVAIGAPVIPKLRLTARDLDSVGSARLAKRILAIIRDHSGEVTSAAVRLLVARRPDDAAEALLAYLPHAENDVVLEEVKTALIAVAFEKGKPAKALIDALDDSHPLRRASAIVALCARGTAEPRDTLRKLLTDKSPTVRLRAALALAEANDPKAVSTLVTLLADLPVEQGREAERFLIDLAGEQSPRVSLAEDDVSKQRARDAWAKWWLGTDGDSLIKELEKRTLTEKLMAQANGLITKMGDESFQVRHTAEADLKKMGPRILPLLRTALRNPDLEIRNRAQKILASLVEDKNTPLSPVVPRLLALRKPKGAAEAILAYLPFAGDESLVDSLQVALNAVAYPSGKPNPAIVKALDEKIAIRRGAAGAALCSGPLTGQMERIRELLKDEDKNVRVRVALALAMAREPEAIPVLIRVIGEGTAEQVSAAEDYLYRLAGDNPPKAVVDAGDRNKDRATAWQRWWDDNKEKVTLLDRSKLGEQRRHLGYVTLVYANNGQIVELDKNNKTRMTITGLQSPYDAQWLRNNRILITEYSGRRVTERDTKGTILWEVKLNFYPIQAERLRNGHTFVVGQNELVHYDRSGREVLRIARSRWGNYRTARVLPNGQIAAITTSNYLIRLDRTGKELKNVRLANVYSYQNEILDNGNVLVPLNYNNQIKEYSPDGKEVRTITTNRPMSVVQLPNKHLLVSTQLRPYKYVELDKSGKEVRSHNLTMYAFRIRAR